ncbi:hypothetical protein CDV31_008151 [Fusarium ambrosium]|uniref:Uncharacterized protein n=1 Tax=Fusarium ambrosium TaxID=131363 RepID=A0A428U2K1_9HYPO|nr:hypothetical protein CDV31_008151 [Fusarium ambrosium]
MTFLIRCSKSVPIGPKFLYDYSTLEHPADTHGRSLVRKLDQAHISQSRSSSTVANDVFHRTLSAVEPSLLIMSLPFPDPRTKPAETCTSSANIPRSTTFHCWRQSPDEVGNSRRACLGSSCIDSVGLNQPGHDANEIAALEAKGEKSPKRRRVGSVVAVGGA